MRPFLARGQPRCATVAAMPLDPVTRRELRRLHARLGPGLALLGNPIGVIFSWFTEPARHRSRRRVYVTADGDVTRTEALPPVDAGPRGTSGAGDWTDLCDGTTEGTT